ncbi:MAG: tyrosine-type recombinase/integrase, partial [Lachnospiraceae bacterium]|nr:tyrosine-type recombinase/integrase [Lachnospiraceae bacterium]
MEYMITNDLMEMFECRMYQEEKASLTIEKYMRDIRCFYQYLGEGKQFNRETVLKYKQHLTEHYQPSSVNSMLAALNHFFEFADFGACKVQQLKIQKSFFCKQATYMTKQDYLKLVKTAENKKDYQLSLIMQTICSTGIRVSELKFITAEAVKSGCVMVNNKGKSRIVYLPDALKTLLKAYIHQLGITYGAIFLNRKGQPVSRGSVWKKMKNLCEAAGVEEAKVFPHNLRHLFAVTFYNIKKDLLYLAEILGHTSIETTRIYTRTPGESHEKLISQLGLVYG